MIEFLISYAWMFVVIAVMAFFLFQIASLYSQPSQPRAAPGNCQVSRPDGPYTTQLISLEGTCNGFPPQYVSSLSQSANGYIEIPLQSPANQLTVSFWIDPTDTGLSPQNIVFAEGARRGSYFDIYWSNNVPPLPVQWQFITLVINTSNPTNSFSLYVNNTLVQTFPAGSATINGINIGGTQPAAGLNGFNGQISNLQLYTVPFSYAEREQLYLEGLGGPPTQLQTLLAWWPLNGDTIDYSGNDRNAASQGGLGFSGIITPQYSPP